MKSSAVWLSFLVALAGCVGWPEGEPVDAAVEPLIGFQVHEKSLLELSRAMRAGTITSEQLVRAYLARIDAYEARGPAINAMISVDRDGAIRRARELDAERRAYGVRGPLHGIPLVLKDVFDVRDMATTAGVVSLTGSHPREDAHQVALLLAEGAIILGKTNLDELQKGGDGFSSLGGQTRNPHALTRGVRGSSSGTGAAVTANFAAFGLGADTNGSLRYPASDTSLVTLRVTEGLSSRAGMVPSDLRKVSAGPMARSISDLAIVLDATVGYDPRDPVTIRSLGRTPDSYTTFLDPHALAGARVAYFENQFASGYLGAPAALALADALDALEAQGATLVRASLAEVIDPALLCTTHDWMAYTTAQGPQMDAFFRSRQEGTFASYGDFLLRGAPYSAYPESTRTLFRANDLGVAILPQIPAAQATAASMREQVKARVLAFMNARGIDVLLYPRVSSVVAAQVPAGATSCIPTPGAEEEMTTGLSSITGFPALVVPAGLTSEGRPVAIELFGRPFAEAKLIALGFAYEDATHPRRSPASTPPITDL